MAGGIDWFRWHHGSVNDPKFGLVARRAQARLGDVLAMWAALLEAASAADDRGNAGKPDFDSLDYLLDMEEGSAKRIYANFIERDMVDPNNGRILAWDKRQPKREREDDKSTERVRAFRERQRQEQPEEATERHETPVERQETPRGEESREEERDTAAAGPERRKSTRAPAAKSTLPDEWAPPDLVVAAMAKEVGVAPSVIRGPYVAAFRDACKAKGYTYSDHTAAFRNCVRQDWPRLRQGRRAPPSGPTESNPTGVVL